MLLLLLNIIFLNILVKAYLYKCKGNSLEQYQVQTQQQRKNPENIQKISNQNNYKS